MRSPRYSPVGILAGFALLLLAAPTPASAGPIGASRVYAAHRTGVPAAHYPRYDTRYDRRYDRGPIAVDDGVEQAQQDWPAEDGYDEEYPWQYRPGSYEYIDDPGALGSPQRYLHFRDRSYDRGYGYRRLPPRRYLYHRDGRGPERPRRSGLRRYNRFSP
jgi:hypothetical protein